MIVADIANDNPDVGGLQVVDDMGYFNRIDLDWNRDEYCSDRRR